MIASGFTATALRMSSGVLIWAAHFLAIYGFTAIACARGFASAQWLGMGVLPLTIGAATAVAASALAAIVVQAMRTGRSSFTEWMAAALAGLALIAVLWEGLAVLLVPGCA